MRPTLRPATERGHKLPVCTVVNTFAIYDTKYRPGYARGGTS